MKNRIATLILCACAFIGNAQTLEEYYAGAKKAFNEKDYATFYSLINKAHELHPYHQTILYQKGIASALTDHPEEAVKSLREALLINVNFNLNIPELLSLSGNPDFEALRELQKELQKPIVQSDTATVIKDRELHLESIAPGETKGIFYGASIRKRKAIRINKQGFTAEFTNFADYGVAAVMAMKVQPRINRLWVAASPLPEMENFDSTAHAAVYVFNIINRQLMHVFRPDSLKDFVFGDLIVGKGGLVLVSDSKNNAIFLANQVTGKLDIFFRSEAFWNIQGITLSDDERYLFIADYIKGIFRLDLRTKELVFLKREIMMSLKGIDGLMFYEGSLVAIQNGVSPIRVTQYFLNKEMDAIVDAKIIDRAHPAFNEPTNGYIVDDELYYIANSQWSAYDENHQPVKEKLQDIVILKYKLK